MIEKYKELLTLFYDRIKAVYDKIAMPFYHYYGKDRVDLQYEVEIGRTIESMIEACNVGALFPRLFSEEESRMKFNDLSAERQKDAVGALEKIVEGKTDADYDIYAQEIASIMCIDRAYILVYFPEARVTNEDNKYVDIIDLYARIAVDYKGRLAHDFTLNRTTYPVKQLLSNYLHSHVKGIGSDLDGLRRFKMPCLGTGPIRETCHQLSMYPSGDAEWELFCLELDRYVHTESKAGVPYVYLESIGSRSSEDSNIDVVYTGFSFTGDALTTGDMRRFTDYLIESRKLRFNYVNGSYSIGMSMLQYMVLASNLFIEWYNDSLARGARICSKDRLFAKSVLMRVTVSNGKVFRDTDVNDIGVYTMLIGEPILKFKGKDVLFNIIDMGNDENNKFVMLNPRLAISALNEILKVLNFRYGKEKAKGRTEFFYDSILETDAVYI